MRSRYTIVLDQDDGAVWGMLQDLGQLTERPYRRMAWTIGSIHSTAFWSPCETIERVVSNFRCGVSGWRRTARCRTSNLLLGGILRMGYGTAAGADSRPGGRLRAAGTPGAHARQELSCHK